MSYISEIVSLIKKAQAIALKNGFKNLLQPGLVKEMIIADILGHEVSRTKHEPDAYDPENQNLKYEYLSCFERGSFQLDRMFKFPQEKREKSLKRITRNHKIFCAIFSKVSPLTVLSIYELEVPIMLTEANRQLDSSSNDISHISFSIKWVENHGKKVYQNSSES